MNFHWGLKTKLQPNRAWYLRGFDGRGASGALHSTTATGATVTVTGHFQDADDWSGHLRLKHLPNFDLSGLGLERPPQQAHVPSVRTYNSLPVLGLRVAQFERIPLYNQYLCSSGKIAVNVRIDC